jgi:hypothetical protein
MGVRGYLIPHPPHQMCTEANQRCVGLWASYPHPHPHCLLLFVLLHFYIYPKTIQEADHEEAFDRDKADGIRYYLYNTLLWNKGIVYIYPSHTQSFNFNGQWQLFGCKST